MKYVKLRSLNVPGHTGPHDTWHLVIDNEEDLFKYAKLDSYLYAHAFLNVERKDGVFDAAHTNDIRRTCVASMLNIAVLGAKEGEWVYPATEVDRFVSKKHIAMFNYIQRYGAIQVNESGGYCGYDGFVNTWKCEVIQTIIKDTAGFPIETAALTANTLILENQNKVYYRFRQQVEAIAGEAAEITMLKEKDEIWVLHSIQNASTIALSSQLDDREQIDRFMLLFSKMPHKRLILNVAAPDQRKLTEHKLWEVNNMKHEIVFI